ncbi:hypothetical protein [Brachyspira innocens]|uniref:hypothetical protein n=1 Tax=Brachyspira innocens TaxID=13264 RepID=UPI0026EA6057|nr:hypothetical protein [Brachyspira innocens]
MKYLYILFIILSMNTLYLEAQLYRRSGIYVDKENRKLIIYNDGSGIFEENGIKSKTFKIGNKMSLQNEYIFIFNFKNKPYSNTHLIFIDDDNIVLIINNYIKYYFEKE